MLGVPWGQDTRQAFLAALVFPFPLQPPTQKPAPLGEAQSGLLSHSYCPFLWGPGRWDESYHAKRMQKKEEKLISSGMMLFILPKTNITDTHCVGGPASPCGDREAAHYPLPLPLHNLSLQVSSHKGSGMLHTERTHWFALAYHPYGVPGETETQRGGTCPRAHCSSVAGPRQK